jgi:hypothetical protein
VIGFIRFVRALRIALFGIPWRECRHQYVILKEIANFECAEDKFPVAHTYVSRCVNCGDITKERV